MKRRILILILIFLLLLPTYIFGYTVDDVRDIIGKDRLDGVYTQSEIDLIIEQYMQIEQANEQVRMFEQLIDKEERERIAQEYKSLQDKLELATKNLSENYQNGASLKEVLKSKSELENIIAEINNFKDKGYDVEIEYIPNIWEEEYNKVQEVIAAIENDMFEIGDLGDSLESPARAGFYITSLFGLRLNPFTQDSLNMHYGLDIYSPEGSDVYALWNGIVSNIYETDSGGLTVELSHGQNLKTYYMHLSKVLVEMGQEVWQYDTIALSGNSGKSTGPHLHLGINLDGEFINPLLVFGEKSIDAMKRYITDNPYDWDKLQELEDNLKNLPTYAKDGTESNIEVDEFFGSEVKNEPFSKKDFYNNLFGDSEVVESSYNSESEHD